MSTINKQIEKFKEKVEMSAQAYAAGSSAEVLKKISGSVDLTSLHNLKQFYKSLEESGEHGVVVTYIKWYLDNISYLRELKANFKSRIYRPLLQNSGVDASSADARTLYRVSDLAAHLVYELERLDTLLDYEGAIDENLFTSESITKQITKNKLIHLVPDILLKLDRVAKLAKVWADKEKEERARRNSEVIRLEKAKTMLVGQLSVIHKAIESEEKELEMQSDILQSLLEREDRSDLIMSETHQLEVKLNHLKEKLEALQLQITDIQTLISTTNNNAQFRDKLKSDLKVKQTEQKNLKSKITLVKYQMQIVLEDLCVEMEIKPSLIRLSNSVQDHCMQLENALESRRLQKQKLESFLRPLSEGNKATGLKLQNHKHNHNSS